MAVDRAALGFDVCCCTPAVRLTGLPAMTPMLCAWQHSDWGQWQRAGALLELCLNVCGLWCRDSPASADAAMAVAQLQLMLGQESLTAASSSADTALISLRTAVNTVSQYGEAMLQRTPAVSAQIHWHCIYSGPFI